MTAAAVFDVRLERNNNNVILLDIIVTKDKQLRALRPVYDSHNPIPLTKKERDGFMKTAHPDRLNKRILGDLKGRSLTRAKHLANATIGMLPADCIKIVKDVELGSFDSCCYYYYEKKHALKVPIGSELCILYN